MKKRTRIIIGIIVVGILLLNSFYFLPQESSLYLKSDIANFKKSIMPISIILTLIITLFGTFDRKEYSGKIWSKLIHILYIGMMCIIIYPIISDFVVSLGLKTNRLSSNESINKNFIVTFKNRTDSENLVYGRIPNRKYDGPIDRLNLNKKEFELINEKQMVELEMRNGLFGIPFNPIIKE